MRRSTGRILTTHVGSLPRPVSLEDVEEQGGDSRAAVAILRDSVADVVRRQIDAGVDVVNDGELGKSGWTSYPSESRLWSD